MAQSFADRGMDILREGAGLAGIVLTSEAQSMIRRWFEFYCIWQGRRVSGFNKPRDLAVKLILDSFAVGFAFDGACTGKALDLGSGNGWPGLAVRLASGGRDVALLDSRKGACSFLRGFVANSGINGVSVLEARAEAKCLEPEHACGYALVTSRAMAPSGVALELSSGFVRVGGVLVLWIGPEDTLLETSEAALQQVGLGVPRVYGYDLPYEMGRRRLAVYPKIAPAWQGFPRRLSAIRRKPLSGRLPGQEISV